MPVTNQVPAYAQYDAQQEQQGGRPGYGGTATYQVDDPNGPSSLARTRSDPNAVDYLDPAYSGSSADPFGLRREGRDEYTPFADAAGQRVADPMAYGAQQDDLVAMMMARARGEGPSAAQSQMQMGIDQTLAAQRAAAASGRGAPVGAANRALAQQGAATMLSGNQQLAQLRADEMNQAYDQAAQTIQAGNDLGARTGLAQTAMNDELTQYYMTLGYSVDEAARQAEMQRMNLAQGFAISGQEQGVQIAGAGIGAAGTAVGIMGSAAMASDVRVKTNVKKADGLVEELMDGLAPYEWDYKEARHGGKGHVGVMAQDVEKSRLGKTIVGDMGDGVKGLDKERLLTAAMASIANTHRRLKKLERKAA